MKLTRAAAVSIALALALGPARARSDDASDPFPLGASLRWTYVEKRTGFGGPKEEKVTFATGATESVRGLDCRLVTVKYDDREIALWYSASSDGVRLARKIVTQGGRAGGDEVRAPELFLKLPLTKGDRWKYGWFNCETCGDEDVSVPAGKFKCTRIELKRDPKCPRPICNVIGMAESITLWLAPGTGIVREEWTVVMPVVPREPPVFTRELEKFEK